MLRDDSAGERVVCERNTFGCLKNIHQKRNLSQTAVKFYTRAQICLKRAGNSIVHVAINIKTNKMYKNVAEN